MIKKQYHTTTVLAAATTAFMMNAGVAHASNFGMEIPNIAEVTYTIGVEEHVIVTNEVVFTIQAPIDEAPTIEFFRYSPTAADPVMVSVNGSDYAPSGELEGPFDYIGEPLNTGTLLDLSQPVPLIPATSYLSGELAFVRVTDSGANENFDEIDTLVITVEAESGDSIVMRLYESGPDTGEFWAYVQSTTEETPENDIAISAGDNDKLTATYEDVLIPADGTSGNIKVRVVVDTATFNPCNSVFDAITGELVNGAVVTLLNAGSQNDATVFGIDGFSNYPATVTSGETITDEAGLNYTHNDGGFTFPYLGEGEYVIEVIPPEGYKFASIMTPDVINENTGAGYFIVDGSYGLPFEMTEVGYIRFDIPLDPISELVVSKVSDRSVADIGDFVNYTVSIQNYGLTTVPVDLMDTLPLGFRYVSGTSMQGDLHIDDPAVSDNATMLTYPMGMIGAGETITLNYALEIGPAAHLGEAINEAVVMDGDGDTVSNIARASIELREDLLRTRSTIIGRISEQSCDGQESWAREIQRGVGVDGVRLYMETGAYAVSDPDGLFHFEGVTEGTHVVQVDEETLPQGYEVMVCEENSQYAGSAYSKFVDVQGGGIWRANFYLKQTGEQAVEIETEQFNDATEYKKFDDIWLEAQNDSPEWVYPLTSRTPSKPSVNIGIKHPVGGRVELSLNGQPVPSFNLMGRDTNLARTVMVSRWRGVDILEGRNSFTAIIKDSQGAIIKTLEEEVWYATNIARASAVTDRSTLVADGRTVPVLAIRLEDESGRPVHAGRLATIDVESPYRIYDETGENRLKEQASDLIAPLSARQDISVGPDGIAMVRLEPTLQTGKVTVIVTLDNGRQVPLYLYLEPEKRDWIVVGLAEGSAGYETLKDKAIDLSDSDGDTFTDGRVAFFAKGLIKGNWLMTLAVDTDKRRGDQDGDFASEIDPNAYYTLYGDRSYQELEAQSRYPVYLKLEKKSAYALFGDFDTNITEGRLTSYNRRLSGLKAEYVSEKLQVLGFAAETNQGFAKDELAADGTSGTYQLSQERILAQSEKIVVETRDRNRPDIVLDRKEMVRYLDYTLDYLTGQLIFRLPVDVSDTSFNPNVIVVDYETSEEAERNITAGGRVQVKDGFLRAGSSFVHQEGSGQTSGAKSNMIGLDIVAKISDNTEARIEYAVTENQADTVDKNVAEGVLAEIIHTSESINAEAYYREEESGYGLGQTNSNTSGFRRYGVKANVRVNQFEDEETGRRGSQYIEGAAYHEDNLGTGDSRDTAQVMAHHQGEKLTVGAGLRVSQDELLGGETRDSLLAVASASLRVPKHGATLQLSHEQPLGGKDAVSNHPERTTLGLDKTIGDKASVSIRHELLSGDNADSENTVLGLDVSPWTGSAITASTDLVTNDSGRRLGSTVGLDQQIRIDDHVTGSIGVTNRKVHGQKGTYVDVSADAALSPLETNEDFTSGYVGLGYNSDTTTVSGRLETRQSSEGDTWIASLGAARELSEELSLASSVRSVTTDPSDALKGDQSQTDARLGLAWRPRSEDTVIFDRLDYNHQTDERGQTRTKIVNNLAANTMISDRWQLTANYGAKYVREDIAGQKHTSFNHLVGGETRFDITKKIDVGLHGSVLTNGDSAQYSFGPSIGFAPVDDVWISAGYNVDGFEDKDFEAAEYSRKGVYVKLRIKFDQNSAKGLLKRISPAASSVGTANVQPQAFSTP